MNIEVGTDIASIERMEKVINRHGFFFLKRFLLPSEIIMLNTRLDSKPSLILDNMGNTRLRVFDKTNLAYYEEYVSSTLWDLERDFRVGDYKLSSITAFWSLKEALSKAFGVGIGSLLGFYDICIYKDSLNKPYVALSLESKMNLETNNKYEIKQISASISHDSGFAIAVCAITYS
ncbi:holo-[acyl-carrier-protein] synthase [Helicobacter muridarum]|uniref:Holo-[acyl-carrier-protein] synthase n=1 Tax=Helicobacter muridarum TaxID=216 RepID=A0A377PSS6_9HELI|nr:holo-ACP synthase [Helicobacter muridarum]TLD99011.1 holo-[acyl-carrier-protein] synthase [Helicobacter muridarum]STQ85424.1 4'-phosphopantetheinyl transferase [Helicobacter muridarum]